MPRFDIVAVAENTSFLVWQAMLFHYSCVKHLGQAPIVVVHKNDEPLLPGFQRIADTGGNVQPAPNYRRRGGVNYPPRNSAATLRHVKTNADYLVLCDCDMVFLKPIQWHAYALKSSQISFDRVAYLDPDANESQPTVDEVSKRAGVDPRRLREQPIRGGVPHILPTGLARRLAADWLECIEMFPTIDPWALEVAGAASRECHVGPQKYWLAAMWALVLAVHRLNLEPVMTDLCISNFEGAASPPQLTPTSPALIHYCYPEAGFNKHAFDGTPAAEQLVWQVAPDDGTISGAIRGQLREAQAFYRICEGVKDHR